MGGASGVILILGGILGVECSAKSRVAGRRAGEGGYGNGVRVGGENLSDLIRDGF